MLGSCDGPHETLAPRGLRPLALMQSLWFTRLLEPDFKRVDSFSTSNTVKPAMPIKLKLLKEKCQVVLQQKNQKV